MEISQLSDEQINLKVIQVMRPNIVGSDIHEATGIECFQDKEGTPQIAYQDFCRNWGVTGPLMVESNIGLSNAGCGRHLASYGAQILNNYQSSWNGNPLRAICECFLMVNQAKAA